MKFRIFVGSLSKYYFLIDVQNMVYCWGNNERNKMGMPWDSVVKIQKFIKHPILNNRREYGLFMKFSTGYHHTLALNRSGKVYSTGYSDNLQLCRKIDDSYDAPDEYEVIWGEIESYSKDEQLPKFRDVQCGAYNSFFISVSDALYVAGRNSHGALGLGDFKPYSDIGGAKLVESLRNVKVLKVMSGDQYTVIQTRNGELYACGCGFDGRLPVRHNPGFPNQFLSPNKVTFFELNRRKVLDFSVGCFHTCFLTSEGKVFLSGTEFTSTDALSGETINVRHLHLLRAKKKKKGLSHQVRAKLVTASSGRFLIASDRDVVYGYGGGSEGEEESGFSNTDSNNSKTVYAGGVLTDYFARHNIIIGQILTPQEDISRDVRNFTENFVVSTTGKVYSVVLGGVSTHPGESRSCEKDGFRQLMEAKYGLEVERCVEHGGKFVIAWKFPRIMPEKCMGWKYKSERLQFICTHLILLKLWVIIMR